MFAQSLQPSKRRSPQQAAEEINRAMVRFNLIVRILGELDSAELPSAADADIRHGCERALTAMLVELARIEPANEDSNIDLPSSPLDQLYDKTTCRLIDSDQLLRMEQFIKRILKFDPLAS